MSNNGGTVQSAANFRILRKKSGVSASLKD